jgi:hypothetical protein
MVEPKLASAFHFVNVSLRQQAAALPRFILLFTNLRQQAAALPLIANCLPAIGAVRHDEDHAQ